MAFIKDVQDKIILGRWKFFNLGNLVSGNIQAIGVDEQGNLGKMGAGSISVAWGDVTGKPITFAPSAHTHTIAQVTGLQTALDSKQATGDYATNTALTNGLAGKANTSHTQAFTTITGTATAAQIPVLPTSKITTGTFAIAQTNSVLTGLAAGTNEAVAATDTLLAAIAKLQAQITALQTP